MHNDQKKQFKKLRRRNKMLINTNSYLAMNPQPLLRKKNTHDLVDFKYLEKKVNLLLVEIMKRQFSIQSDSVFGAPCQKIL